MYDLMFSDGKKKKASEMKYERNESKTDEINKIYIAIPNRVNYINIVTCFDLIRSDWN